MVQESGEFLRHEACDSCGSSDANAVYSDGHTHCFSCDKHTGTDRNTTSSSVTTFHNPALLSPDFVDLPARGLVEQTCRKWKYGVATYMGKPCHVATYCDSQGKPVAQKVRFQDKRFQILGDAKAMTLFGDHLWRDGGKMVVVTEGELDALSLSQVQQNRWPVVSVPNGAQSAKKAIQRSLEWLETYESVVFMFDQDEPGVAAARDCASLITPGKAKIATLPLKDASDCLTSNKTKEMIDAMWSAKVYRPDGIVGGDEALAKVRAQRNALTIGGFPHHGLEQATRGLRCGEVTTITSGSGMGKTELVREIAYCVIKQGLRLGYIALEESVARAALGLVGLELCQRLHFDEDPEEVEGFQEAWDRVVGKDNVYFYDHFGSLESANLISKIRYMSRGLECDVVILDHISIVISGLDGGDERRIIDNLMTKLTSLAEETGLHLILVSHLKRPHGTPHEEGGRTTLAQLRGSGAIGQLSNTVIGLERDQQGDNPNVSTLRVLKCRWTGFTGIGGYMQYDPDTGRMSECEQAEEEVGRRGDAEF